MGRARCWATWGSQGRCTAPRQYIFEDASARYLWLPTAHGWRIAAFQANKRMSAWALAAFPEVHLCCADKDSMAKFSALGRYQLSILLGPQEQHDMDKPLGPQDAWDRIPVLQVYWVMEARRSCSSMTSRLRVTGSLSGTRVLLRAAAHGGRWVSPSTPHSPPLWRMRCTGTYLVWRNRGLCSGSQSHGR